MTGIVVLGIEEVVGVVVLLVVVILVVFVVTAEASLVEVLETAALVVVVVEDDDTAAAVLEIVVAVAKVLDAGAVAGVVSFLVVDVLDNPAEKVVWTAVVVVLSFDLLVVVANVAEVVEIEGNAVVSSFSISALSMNSIFEKPEIPLYSTCAHIPSPIVTLIWVFAGINPSDLESSECSALMFKLFPFVLYIPS